MGLHLHKMCVCAFAAGMSVLAATFPALAQTSLATVRGKVTDEQGGLVAGVTVTARQVETNISRSSVTEKLGQFFLPNLPAGAYELTAELSGFATGKRVGLVLRVGQEVTADFALKVASLQESVTVGGQAALVETQHTLGAIIEKKDIDDLPTVTRDFADLAKLAPGTSTSAFAGANVGSGLSIGGQRQYANNIFVDGATNLMQFYGRQANSYPQDWIQEFQVMTNGFAAEYGQSGGGVLNVITRSGANTFNGRMYGFFRDNAFDSPPFAGRFESGKPVFLDKAPTFSQQRIGGILGGPIVKDRLFFFTGVEHRKLDSSTVLGISEYWRQQGVKSVIPGGTRSTSALAKVDWNVNRNNRVTARYDRDARTDRNVALRGSPLETEEDRYRLDGPLWNVLGSWASTLSNSSFNELRVFYGVNKPFISCNLAQAGGAALLQKAAPGTYAIRTYPGAVFGCPGFGGLEGEANLHVIDSFLFTLGSHQIKIGGQLARSTIYMDVDVAHKGSWSFPEDRVFDRNDPRSFPDTFGGTVGNTVFTGSYWSPSVYFQDTWKIKNNLTLNLGVRYDEDGTILAGNDLVDARNASLVARLGGAPPLTKMKRDLNNVAPRLGFVWVPTADRRTTIRGSGGLFYEQNHFNFNDIYIINTLLADRGFGFNASDPTQNPFNNPANPAAGVAALRAFLATNYPLFPDLSRATVVRDRIGRLDSNFVLPSTAQLAIGLTHDFGRGFDVQADYVYIRGRDMIVNFQDNLQIVNGQFVTRDPRFASISVYKNLGWSRYHALQTHAQYTRSSTRLGLSYTLSKTTSNTQTGITGGPGFGSVTNPFDLSIDVGPDNADRRHNLVFNASHTFPLDIQAAAIGIYRSPLPYSVSSRFVVFARPEPRSSRRGDSEKTVDLRLSKIIKLGKRVTASAFWEMFNLFNTDNFASFQGSLESPAFGLPLTQLEKRRQQLGVKIDLNL